MAGRAQDDGQLLERAMGLTHDPLRRAEIQLLRGRQIVWHGEPARAHELLVREAGRVRDLAPGMAAMMLAEASFACGMTGDVPKALETAREARAAAVDDGGIQEETVTALLLASALQLSGERQPARALLERYLPALRGPQALRGPGDLVALIAHSFSWLEEYDIAGDLYDRVVAAARAASAPAALPYALAGRSELALRTGRWPAAMADAVEAIELGEELGQPAVTGWALSCLAIVEAGRGEATSCRNHLARANALVTRSGASSGHTATGAALGLLELGLGRPDLAVAALEPVARFTQVNGLREPQVVQWAPDLVEALVHSGRHQEAVSALESFDEQARHTGGAWALAAAARCHGLLASDEDFERWFDEALDRHQGLSTPFERARTEQCYGERLRRAGRRTRARTPLRSALAAFDALGAAPWSQRARAELRATGETVRRRQPSAADHLTPQETQVALLVAGGATNREAAASLFVTPKTIEFHLGGIYRKLGIHSRTQLSVRLSRGDPVPGAAATTDKRTTPTDCLGISPARSSAPATSVGSPCENSDGITRECTTHPSARRAAPLGRSPPPRSSSLPRAFWPPSRRMRRPATSTARSAGDGKQTTDFGGVGPGAGVAIQADGKIVVAGGAGGDFALARYNADGSLDTSFGATAR